MCQTVAGGHLNLFSLQFMQNTQMRLATNKHKTESVVRSIVRKLFFLCVTPNILNGFHVSSYVFLGQLPTEHWCVIPELMSSNYSMNQMRNLSST